MSEADEKPSSSRKEEEESKDSKDVYLPYKRRRGRPKKAEADAIEAKRVRQAQ